MPCDGIAVMKAQMIDALSVIEKLGGYVVEGPENVYDKRTRALSEIRALLSVPAGDVNLPVKIAMRQDGSVEAITTDGTFELGVDALSNLVEELQEQGVEVGELGFETHVHDHHAPQQAYSVSTQY